MTIGYQIVLTDESLRKNLFRAVQQSGTTGVTIEEFRQRIPKRHHGHLSGVLSQMHEDEVITQLAEKRDNCRPYIGLEFVNGRETREHQSYKMDPQTKAVMKIVREMLEPAESLHGFGTTQTKGDRSPRPYVTRIQKVMKS